MAYSHPSQRDGSELASEFQETEAALTRLGASILQLQNNDPPEEEQRTAMIDDLEERFHELRQRFEELEAAEHARSIAESEQAEAQAQAGAPAADGLASARARFDQFKASTDETLQTARQRVDQAYQDLRTIVANRRSAHAAKGAQLSVGERFDRAWKDVSDRFERGLGRKANHGGTLGSEPVKEDENRVKAEDKT